MMRPFAGPINASLTVFGKIGTPAAGFAASEVQAGFAMCCNCVRTRAFNSGVQGSVYA
jgi:hypothetical protein